MRVGISIAVVFVLASWCGAAERVYRVQVTITSQLPSGNVPIDPRLDLGKAIHEAGGSGVLDPNSIEVIDSSTGKAIPFARTDDFAYGDVGRIEWVVTDAGIATTKCGFATRPRGLLCARKHSRPESERAICCATTPVSRAPSS